MIQSIKRHHTRGKWSQVAQRVLEGDSIECPGLVEQLCKAARLAASVDDTLNQTVWVCAVLDFVEMAEESFDLELEPNSTLRDFAGRLGMMADFAAGLQELAEA